ncbi:MULTISPECIES: TetR/AcrR family transcriptional regulator [Actinomadura]|uniref:TetR/AcrR family transcriptional regulator n=1 Tax=Actinomadura yumaensis TaxID=111807 RepID=A0ABW2CZV4_9ACTN|nr:TetR/AcrR family transcriptional regulator [Actinomadura sp. J1-007]MWK38943.1 TetR family transcriptional regulator [Actinomadura sp. J1-007]
MASTSSERPVRVRLVEAAARLLSREGPQALTARRLANEVGASTMALYTHFGGMPELVRAVVDEGFARLAAHMAAVPRTADPVADLGSLALAYRANALANPHLYGVMLGGAPLGRYRVPPAELIEGRRNDSDTFGVLVEATKRAMADGRFRSGDPAVVSAQLWSAIHGFVMLELAGHLAGEPDVETVLTPLLATIAAGLGDDPEATARSVAAVRSHLRAEAGAGAPREAGGRAVAVDGP